MYYKGVKRKPTDHVGALDLLGHHVLIKQGGKETEMTVGAVIPPTTSKIKFGLQPDNGSYSYYQVVGVTPSAKITRL